MTKKSVSSVLLEWGLVQEIKMDFVADFLFTVFKATIVTDFLTPTPLLLFGGDIDEKKCKAAWCIKL